MSSSIDFINPINQRKLDKYGESESLAGSSSQDLRGFFFQFGIYRVRLYTGNYRRINFGAVIFEAFRAAGTPWIQDRSLTSFCYSSITGDSIGSHEEVKKHRS